MLGPIPTDDIDDMFNPSAAGAGGVGGNAATTDAVLAWQERQRRQRTVRVLVMFFMMLLLMETEEPTNRRSNRDVPSSIHLRQRGKRMRGGGGGGGKVKKELDGTLNDDVDDDDNNADDDGGAWGSEEKRGRRKMDVALFDARRFEDARIAGAVAVGHGRMDDLVARNGGEDLEAVICEGVAAAFAEEEAASKSASALASASNAGEKGNDAAKTAVATMTTTTETEEEKKTRERKEAAVKWVAANRRVFHYPRNATGYYRGEWTRIDGGGVGGDDDDINNNHHHDDYHHGHDHGHDDYYDNYDNLGGNVNPYPNGLSDDELESDAHIRVELVERSKKQNDGGVNEHSLVVVDEHDIEYSMKRRLGRKRDAVAVMLLPPGLVLRSEFDGNATGPPFYAPGRSDQDGDSTNGAGSSFLSSLSSSSTTTSNQPQIANDADREKHLRQQQQQWLSPSNLHPKLSLTRKSGRTALQLYARPIPAMSEISIVEGYVKLYDGSKSAFVSSTKRDVLLRVRGVVVHALGKMSLVANADPGRSALVINGAGAGAATTTAGLYVSDGKNRIKDDASETGKRRTSLSSSSKVGAMANGNAELMDKGKDVVKESNGVSEKGRSDGDDNGDGDGGVKKEEEKERRRRLRAALSDYLEAERGGAPSFGGDGISGASLFRDDDVNGVLLGDDDNHNDDDDDDDNGSGKVKEGYIVELGGNGGGTAAAASRNVGLLERIRDDALSLFGRATALDGWDEPEPLEGMHDDNAQRSGWTTLMSPEFHLEDEDDYYYYDDDDDDDDAVDATDLGYDNLFYGEPVRQMAELVGRFLNGPHGNLPKKESAVECCDGVVGESGESRLIERDEEMEGLGRSGWSPTLVFAGRRSLRESGNDETPAAAKDGDDANEAVLVFESEGGTVADGGMDESGMDGEKGDEVKAISATAGLDGGGGGSGGSGGGKAGNTADAMVSRRRAPGTEGVDGTSNGATGEYENLSTVEESSRRTRITKEQTAMGAAGPEKPDAKPDQRVVDADRHQRRAKSDVVPYPYAPDDPGRGLSRAPSQLARRIPHRELALKTNGLGCEFELSFDIKAIQWTLGEWQDMAARYARGIRDLDPHPMTEGGERGSADDLRDVGTHATRGSRGVLSSSSSSFSNSQYRGKKSRSGEDSLVMNLNGTIYSPNCGFRSAVNVTAIRTDWEHTTGKAINYSFYMMLTCLTQIVVLLRQLLHTQAPSAAVRVSLLCIGWQTVLDAILCVGHIFLCLVMQPLFTAFASVAFFKLLIFCIIEMKYMAIIIQARHNAANNNNASSSEELRRRVTLLHLRFYAALIFATAGFWIAGQKHRTLYVLFLYSFWVPQIVCNVITEAKKPLHPYFIYGMSITRLVAPIYMFALPNNFMKEVNPDFPTDIYTCELLVLWVAVQTAILVAQGKYGARFMVPDIFLPPKFDYSRPIPPSMLPPPPPPPDETTTSSSSRNGSDDATELLVSSVADGADGAVKQRGPRHRKGTGGKSSRRRHRHGDAPRGTMIISEPVNGGGAPRPTLDCVICYNDIDISDRMGYMLAPCDHIFHRSCLEQWMDVKMECPICRKELPAL